MNDLGRDNRTNLLTWIHLFVKRKWGNVKYLDILCFL